ncbi:MAG: hypothetical protein U1E65_24240 [Myxococcota bacterium]
MRRDLLLGLGLFAACASPAEAPLVLGPVTLEEYCGAEARAYCHQAERCRPDRFSVECAVAEADRCRRSFVPDRAAIQVEVGLIRIDAAALGAALSAYANSGCAELAPIPPPEAGAVGLLPDGRACLADDTVCSSGACVPIPRAPCGSCGPAAGQSPRCAAECPLGQACAAGATRCTVIDPLPGQSGDGTGLEGASCTEFLDCRAPLGCAKTVTSSVGTCLSEARVQEGLRRKLTSCPG